MTALITRARLATLAPDEAAALFLVQQDEGAPVEAGLFETWLLESPENRDAWDAVQSAWSLFDDVDDPAFAALRESALAAPKASRLEGLQSNWRPAAAAAALIAVVVGGFQLSRGNLNGADQIASTRGVPSSERVYAALPNEGLNAVLADGTRMTLDANARARVAIAPGQRQVVLERGGAEFSVKHDASRPFTVAALDRTIVDIGTRFKVALAPGSMDVMLYEGSVQVNDAGSGRATVLRPGQKLVIRAGTRDMIVPIPSEGAAPGELVQFDDVTLAAAAETINQGGVIKLVITDPRITGLRVSGRFRAGDPERFARTVSELLSLRVVRTGKLQIELRPRR
jgi:transmembrane sensor